MGEVYHESAGKTYGMTEGRAFRSVCASVCFVCVCQMIICADGAQDEACGSDYCVEPGFATYSVHRLVFSLWRFTGK